MNKYFHAGKLLLLACLMLGGLQPALAAGPITINVNGTDYTLQSELLSYTGNEARFQAQPWWGDAALSAAISTELQYQLGDLEGGPGTDPGIPSALLAYGDASPDVSITYWDGGLEDCPSGCPGVGEPYFYVFATGITASAEPVPALPVGLILLLAGLLAAIGVRRIR